MIRYNMTALLNMCLEEAGESLILKNIRSIDGDTPAGIACVLRLQAQAMPAAREPKQYEVLNINVAVR